MCSLSPASRRPLPSNLETYKGSRRSLLFLQTLSLSLPHARAHTQTQHPSRSFQNHRNKVTGEAPGIPFFVPSKNNTKCSQASAIRRPRSTEEGACTFCMDCHFRGNSSHAGFKYAERDFSGLISCSVPSAKIGKKPLVRK